MSPQKFQEILRNHKRVAIVGGPQTGKTTLARTVTDRPVHHNDDGKHMSWEDQPQFWIHRTSSQDSFVIEGVQAARALRKGLEVDAVVELTEPYGKDLSELNPGQQSMHKGHTKIFGDVLSTNPQLKVYR